MSEPKRYFLKMSPTISGIRCDTYEHKDGEFVDYADYNRLKAEATAKDFLIVQLKAEVERLKVAEDALDAYNEGDVNLFVYFHGIWHAAKEGKPKR